MLVECHRVTARHKTCEASFVSSLGMSLEIDVYVCKLIAREAYVIVITTAEVFDSVALRDDSTDSIRYSHDTAIRPFEPRCSYGLSLDRYR